MKCTLHWVAWVLVVIGAINWGLVGAFGWNLVETIAGMGTVADIIYIIVGIAGIVLIFEGSCKGCKMKYEVKPASPPQQ
ncbi:MAG: DUF378 domain-containing protein [Patescibacteria group bacterium]